MTWHRRLLRAVALSAVVSFTGPLAAPILSATASAAVRKRSRPRRPTRAERAAETRRREAERQAALRRQRAALEKAWQADKGCYQAGGSVVPEPRLVDDDSIEIPSRARGGPLRAALLIYEAHVDKSGHLHSLRTLRPLPREHPWPLLHEAVVASVRGWKWSKTKVAGKTVPVCFTLTLNLDLRQPDKAVKSAVSRVQP